MCITEAALLRSCTITSIVIVRTVAAAVMILIFLLPAHAQFWGDSWGGRQQQRQQPYNTPFGGQGSDRQWGYWGDRQWENLRYPRQREPERQPQRDRSREADREQPPDYSHAPPAAPRKDAAIKIVVIGDANADWLAYGLEEAFSEQPEVGVVRKHRTDSGLIRYDQRRDSDWSQAVREIIAADRPRFIVMMIGNNDRQAIREKASTTSSVVAPKASAQPRQIHPLGAPLEKSDRDLEQHPSEQGETARTSTNPMRSRPASYGPWDFQTEEWERAYIRRIDATIAAAKSAGVPMIWVGLPSQRGTRASADVSYLNELYRSRAEKLGAAYVDIWEGFVDEGGKFSAQGPDYLGQIRRLRANDGVYFTKFGARKLAHYVQHELERGQKVPVALPQPVAKERTAVKGKPGGGARPAAGPVVPLTGAITSSEKVLLGATVNPVADQSTEAAVAVPPGRADDFRWPRSDFTTDGAAAPTSAKE
jgi:uncharacterized protein